MVIRKKFIDVECPLINEKIPVLGTTESLSKKTIKMDLTRRLRGKNLEIIFKISDINGQLIGLPKKMELMKFYIRRMIRKRANYVEDSFESKSKDVKVTIKPFLITRKKVSRAVRNNLRKTAREFLIDYIKDKIYLEICDELLKGELQKKLLPRLKKIYPLSFCDIRIFETKEIEKLELKQEELKQVEEEKSEKEEEIQIKNKEEEKEEVKEKKNTNEKTENKEQKIEAEEKAPKKKRKDSKKSTKNKEE